MPALILPMLGTERETGTVLLWYKTEGDPVRIGDLVCQVETAKAVFDIDAPAEGTLVARRVPVGGKVETLAPLGWIGAPGEIPRWEEAAGPALSPADSRSSPARPAAAPPVPVPEAGAVRATPRARTRARELGLDLRDAARTLPGKVLTESDVDRLAAGER